MASLTPGTLLKLLQSMNTDAKVAGEHRSVVLQVIGIVPALAGPDLWPSHGFYIQLSDSANSTYVSLSDADADVILSNRPQLGHFVHLDRLHFDSPVPRASGVRPIPGRPHPFIGTPEPLVARISPSQNGFVIQPASSDQEHGGAPIFKNFEEKGGAVAGNRTVFAERENVVPVKNQGEKAATTTKRRFSSPASLKTSARKCGGGAAELRFPSPAGKGTPRPSSPALGRAGSRSSSPVPSKSVVPSLVAAKEENRTVAKEPGIVVPSRYRQPSPVGGRKKVGGLKTKLDAQPIVRTQIAMTRRLSDASGRQPIEEEVSKNKKPQPNDRGKSCDTSDKQNIVSSKITNYDRVLTDGSISLDGLSENLARIGKVALQRRTSASTAAAEAIEEACATESVLRSLSTFSDICLSKTGNPLSTIDCFLSIYEDVLKQSASIESLAASRSSGGLSDAFTMERYKSISRWIEAALATDLEVVSLLDGEAGNSSKWMNSEKQTTLMRNTETLAASEPPRTSLSKRNSIGTPAKNQAKGQPNTNINIWTRGCGMGETSELAKTLQHEMKIWFLEFVEQALDASFQLFGESSAGRESSRRDHGQFAAVLSHLKRVNDWLDAVGKKPEDSIAESIERLKQRIYGFVISHMGSALNSSVSLSEA